MKIAGSTAFASLGHRVRRSPARRRRRRVTIGGMKITSTLSTPAREHARSARRYARRVADAIMSTGFRRSPPPAETTAAPRRSLGQRRQLQAPRLARVGREDSRPARVREDGDAPPPGTRLMSEQRRDVEQLLERLVAHHAGLAKQRVDDDVRSPASAPVCEDAARAPAAMRPALTAMIGLRRATRRAICANCRGLPKLSRYSRITSVSGRPAQYCDQVVARHVGLVADRDERRDAEPQLRARSRGSPARARPLCDDIATRPPAGSRRERRVQPHRGIGVDDAHAVRPDHADARARGPCRAARLARRGPRRPSRRSPR